MKDFDFEIDDFIDELRAETVELQKELAEDVAKEICRNSPVSTGSYCSSHRASKNMPDRTFTILPPGQAVPSVIRAETLARLKSDIASMKIAPGDSIYLSNSVPHAVSVNIVVA